MGVNPAEVIVSFKLRDYQEYAVKSTFDYLYANAGNPCVVMPTGSGKAIVCAGIIKQAFSLYPNSRILMATHVKELIQQNADELMAYWPSAPLGIYSAGLGLKQACPPIVFGGVGSLVGNIEGIGFRDLLLVDEAHSISTKDDTMYQKLIGGLRVVNPQLRVIGLTATPYRLGQGMITENGLFDAISCDMSSLDAFNWFIDEGYLVNLVPRPTATKLDVSNVGIQNGDLNQHQLQQAVDVDKVTYDCIQEAIELGADRQSWLVFASGIEHAEHITEALHSFGVSACVVHSKMSKADRDANIADFKAGKYRAIVSNGVLTTGFNHKPVDLLLLLRPTLSPGLHVQILGRGTRPVYAPGFDLSTAEGRLAAIAASPKRDCLVLDFAGNVKRLGPINDPVKPRKKGDKPGEAPIKICPQCGIYLHASARKCYSCGHDFPPGASKLTHAAAELELIRRNDAPKIEWFTVDRVVYSKHSKAGGNPSLKVTYFVGLSSFSEYVCLEHLGFARRKAVDWWIQRMNSATIPSSIDEALEYIGGLAVPRRISVQTNLKYPQVLSHEF